MRNLKTFIVLLFIICSLQVMAQPISTGGTITINCDTQTLNITDSNADGDNYAPGENFEITICPDGGNGVTFSTFAEDGGFFDLAPGDQLFIYDGDNSSAPLIGVYDDASNATGFAVTSTIPNNPTGCLTLVFISTAGSATATGWASFIFCGTVPIPFEATITSDPADVDGYIDICQGDMVTFTAITDYLYNGQGYDQSDETSYFIWDIPDGTTFEGYGLTEISHTFPDPFGYLIELTITDTSELSTIVVEIKVRVSTTPNWSGVLSAFQDTICIDNTSTLIAGITPDTSQSFGVLANPSAFVGGGFFGELLFLPDGGAVQVPPDLYETVIDIDDFPVGQNIENASDIVAICVTMEHSFSGDLELWVQCPDGTEVVLFDAYTGQGTGPGIIPGGYTGGGTFMGEPVDPGTGPGVGYTYCFTPSSTQFGTFEQEEASWGTTIPAGDYLPMGDFGDFIGCEINGPWTLIAADNWGADDGYIFNWSIIFDPTIDPTVENYSPYFTDVWWDDDPSVIVDNDTLIVVQPTSVGDHEYVVNVVDNFGCQYDTTVVLHVLPEPVLSTITPACYLEGSVDVSNVYQSGFWNYTPPNDTSFAAIVPTANGDHIDITVNLPGNYNYVYTDVFCMRDYSTDIFFAPPPIADLQDTVIICLGEEFFYELNDQPDGISVSHVFTLPSAMVSSSPEVLADSPGFYSLFVSSITCPDDQAFDQSFFDFKPCEIETYNIFTPNEDGTNDVFYIQGIEEHPGSVVEVYNRWGGIVFSKLNYRNDWLMEDLSEGTYYFVVVLRNGESHTGDFTVVRD
ncbi:MAG: gliding motility-associated C-terminal domain-containing protein [Flavobacteriales bacterium]|nr:gliding motility-associated C-terminal domain-containing protein [Flavobacteriales bacterium]